VEVLSNKEEWKMKIPGKAILISITIALIVGAAGIGWCQPLKPEEMPTTIVVHWSWDYLPGMDKKAYAEFTKKAVASFMKAPGLIEFRANRNLLGSPHARATTVWRSLEDWAKFGQTKEWHEIEAELRTFVTNIHVELWGPAPLFPKPLRPGK
jgi:heme-degrading monooxygenase HmoA